jgi:hypothetical protein
MTLMTISPHFQDEIHAVDPTKTLIYVINTSTYATLEFSYSGLTITGGSPLGCEYGASELLEAMGFRWYSSGAWGTIRPTTIPTGLTRAKTSYWMPNNKVFLAYGHSFYDIYIADRDTLTANQERWAVLNGLQLSIYPAGHRWEGVIQPAEYRGFFYLHPQFVKNGTLGIDPASGNAFFDLTVIGTDYDMLVNFCAGVLVKEGLATSTPPSGLQILFQDWKRTHFDPSDGDLHSSDQVFPFTKAVADRMQAGTTEVTWAAGSAVNGKGQTVTWPAGILPAQPAVAGAQLGIYAYSGHRLPPTASVAPDVFTQIALAFNKTEFTYQELVDLHGAKADAILLREYWDTQAWSDGQPLINGRMKRGYFDWYDDFQASGAIGINSEYCSNWLVNLVGVRYGTQKCKTSFGTWDDALDDIMAHLFRRPSDSLEDPAVRDLYDFWGTPANLLNKYNLRLSFDFVAEMEDSWYKTLFEQYLVICKKHMYLPGKILKADNPSWPDPAPGDPYPAAIADYAADILGIRMDETFHSFAQLRRDCNGNLSTDYPALWMYRKGTAPDESNPGEPLLPDYTTYPDWFYAPSVPTHEEFVAAHAILTAETPRDADLDSLDLVLVRGVVPVVEAGPEAPHFYTKKTAPYAFVGPGKVIAKEALGGKPIAGGLVETEVFGEGVHFMTFGGDWLVSNEGGDLFLDTFGGVRRDPHEGNTSHWLYVPNRVAGNVSMEAAPRWRFFDESGMYELYPTWHASYTSPANLGPGQVKVDNGNTSGDFNNTGANRWMSKKPTVALLPRVLADEDFPKRAIVSVT